MSYILDALRKSDLQRQRGAAPTLLTTHVTAEAPRQPPVLLYGVLAAALVGMGMVIGWLQPWQPPQPASAPVPAPITLETVRKPERKLPLRNPITPAQPAPAIASANSDAPLAAASAPAGAREKAVALVPGKPADRPADAAQEQPVMNLSELPPAIQQSIPRMSIAVHAYSPKLQDRVVMINNRMMREGQELTPGLRLEQITPDGMIFSFGGYRFRRGLQQSGEMAETK